jgi:hypothetical protein
MNSMFKKRLMSTALVAALAVTYMSPAHALADGAEVVAAIQVYSTQLWAQFAQQFANMKLQTGMITGVIDASSAKTASAIGNATENATQRNIDTVSQLKKYDIIQSTNAPIDPCANAARGLLSPNMDNVQPAFRAGMLSGRGMGGTRGGGGGGGSSGKPSTGNALVDKALDVAEGTRPAPSPEVLSQMVSQGACDAYAAGLRQTMCQSAKLPTSLSTGLPNADINPSSLYDGAQTAANTGKISLTFMKNQMAAASAYIRNIHRVVEPADLSPAEAASDAGKQYLTYNDAYQARSEEAQHPSTDWLNLMAPNTDTIPVLQAMLQGNGAASTYLARALPLAYPQWQSQGISMHQLREIEVDRRFQNPDWIKEIAVQTDPLTLQREQLMVSANTNYLLTQMLMAQEKANILLGDMYQSTLDKDIVPELMALHQKAVSSRVHQ